jgi:hypothetical protein
MHILTTEERFLLHQANIPVSYAVHKTHSASDSNEMSAELFNFKPVLTAEEVFLLQLHNQKKM